MKNIIDMHIHSTYSDGELEPLEIIEACHNSGISTIAITDHNEVRGSALGIFANPYSDLKIIPGIELSARNELKGAKTHILGYNIDLTNKSLNEAISNIRLENIRKVKNIIEALAKYENVTFKEADIQEIFMREGNIGRPDVARLCVKYGYCKTVSEAFDTLLTRVKDKIPKRKFQLEAKCCINLIRQSGGVACLAHPISLLKSENELYAFIRQLVEYGLEAIEVYHSKQSKEYSSMLLNIANDLGLLYSVGSDFHGSIVKPDIYLGSGKDNNLNFSYATILTKIVR